jgi:predicted porin
MQKKLIALAVASLVSAPAFAQSQVTVGGVVDVYVESAKFSDAVGNQTQMGSGGHTTNRLFFKGSEDLGNGMKANFHLEHQPDPDNGTIGAGNFWQRTATVGLSGNWGAVNFGRQYTPWFSARAANDIFYTAGAGSNYLLEGTATRMSNSIRYDSVKMNGFAFAAGYSFGAGIGAAYSDAGDELTTAGAKDVGRQVSINLTYGNGPLALRYGYNTVRLTSGPDIDRQKNTVNGSYDFKVAKLVAGWGSDKTDAGGADFRSWYIGGVIPVFGKDLVKLEYTRQNVKNVSSMDSRLIALGYEHPMSKRTTLYATYAKLNNDSGVANSFLTGGGTVAVGFDPSSFQMGLKHAF